MVKCEFKEIYAEEKNLINQVKMVEEEAFGEGAIDEWVLTPIIRYGKVYALVKDTEIINFVEMLKKWGKEEAYIYSFATKSKYRGKGYAKELLEKTINELKKENLKRVSLTVAPENERAIGLYESFGFIKKDMYKNEYGEGIDRIYMEKEL